ncbi:hypothetical protein STEG23_032146 [Scotinomys teguina]
MARKARQGEEEEVAQSQEIEREKTPVRHEEKKPTCHGGGHHVVEQGYPAVALCLGDPTGLGLQDQLLHVLQKTIDWVDVVVKQLISLVLGLSSGRVGEPTSSPPFSPLGVILDVINVFRLKFSS